MRGKFVSIINMTIKQFENIDIKQASKLAKLTWGDFYTQESAELQTFIYNFMVEYYDLNRKYSLSIFNEDLKGFLLAFTKDDRYNSENFENKVKILKNEKEQQIALDLFNYLETCGKEVKTIMTDDDIFLGLFVSIQKGCGKKLLSKLNDICKENSKKNIYLWTDTTCDYKYYRKNNFTLLKEVETFINGKLIKTLIYRKSV